MDKLKATRNSDGFNKTVKESGGTSDVEDRGREVLAIERA